MIFVYYMAMCPSFCCECIDHSVCMVYIWHEMSDKNIPFGLARAAKSAQYIECLLYGQADRWQNNLFK